MAIAEVTVVPVGTEDTGLSDYVADCQDVLAAEENIKYQLTPMGTIIEGELDDILVAIRKIHEVPFVNGAQRVTTNVKIDDRRDKEASIEQKLNSVKSKLTEGE
ncbi:MTH1187 family thiamine-binding protein [Halanaerobaculum tunisiense]